MAGKKVIAGCGEFAAQGLFVHYYKATDISIPDSVTEIGNSAFSACWNFGVLFNKDKTYLMCYPIGKTETYYEIPDGVEGIYGHAFDYGKNLENVIIPASVIEIPSYTFYQCNENLAIYGYGDTNAEAFTTLKELPFYDLIIVYERFSDIPEVSWYTESVQYVFDCGYMSGKKFNWFDATGTLTRAECAVMLNKYCSLFKG